MQKLNTDLKTKQNAVALVNKYVFVVLHGRNVGVGACAFWARVGSVTAPQINTLVSTEGFITGTAILKDKYKNEAAIFMAHQTNQHL